MHGIHSQAFTYLWSYKYFLRQRKPYSAAFFTQDPYELSRDIGLQIVIKQSNSLISVATIAS